MKEGTPSLGAERWGSGRLRTLQLGAEVLVAHPAAPLPPHLENPGTSRDQVAMCCRMVAPAFQPQWSIIVRGLNPSNSIILGTWQGLIQMWAHDLL